MYKSEKKLFVKVIAITSTFIITYSFEFVIRLYEFITKLNVDPTVDLIGTVGINLNTLLNSIVLLKYDGLVHSSALELLGLEEWWKKRNSGQKKEFLFNIFIISKKDKPALNEILAHDKTKNGRNPNSITTQKIER